MNPLLLQIETESAANFFASSFVIALLFIYGVFFVVMIVAHWMLYRKAGYQGWECIVPIYNLLVLLKIVGKPWWWIFLIFFLMPVLGIGLIWYIWTINMLSKSFGKDEGYTVGILFLGFVFYPILAFGKAEYQGPYGDKAAYDAFQASKHSFDFEQK